LAGESDTLGRGSLLEQARIPQTKAKPGRVYLLSLSLSLSLEIGNMCFPDGKHVQEMSHYHGINKYPIIMNIWEYVDVLFHIMRNSEFHNGNRMG